jgi:hypothetical protein
LGYTILAIDDGGVIANTTIVGIRTAAKPKFKEGKSRIQPKAKVADAG